MARSPVERNVVTRFLLGLAVIAGMMIGATAGGRLFATLAVPFASVAGVLVGALAVFVAFAVWYTRYDASFDAE